MTILNLKPEDQDGVIGRIILICNQIKYLKCEVMPFLNEMEAWEAKEYRNIYHSYQNELNELKDSMIKNISFWNIKLGQYHTSTAVFLNATAMQY